MIFYKKRSFWLIILFFLILTQAPFVFGMVQAGDQYVFGGFLFNPLDGNSYLAKIGQGREGNWSFRLPFSAEQGSGAYLFLFYLFLGHISRWTHLDPILIFHLARLATSLFMIVMIYRFIFHTIGEDGLQPLHMGWLLFGGGLGWLGLLMGNPLAPDLWIAEIYPFLSSFANPHFPLAIGIMVWMLDFTTSNRTNPWVMGLIDSIAGVTLANLSPFAVVIIYFVYGGQVIYLLSKKKYQKIISFCFRGGAFFIFSFPYLLYQAWVVRNDPIFRIWNTQNRTLSPSIGLFILGVSPLIIWALLGIFQNKNKELFGFAPLVWLIVTIILFYFPSSLQRRFGIGLYIPLAVFSIIGYKTWHQHSSRKNLIKLFYLVSFLVSLLTNFVIGFAVIKASLDHSPLVYLTKNEADSYQWMKQNLSKDALILAGSESGNLIPAWSGQRVLYGHPYESVEAERYKKIVEQFFDGTMNITQQKQVLEEFSINYVLWGYRERRLRSDPPEILLSDNAQLIFSNEDIAIYQVLTNPDSDGHG